MSAPGAEGAPASRPSDEKTPLLSGKDGDAAGAADGEGSSSSSWMWRVCVWTLSIVGCLGAVWLLIAYFLFKRSVPMIDMSKHIPFVPERAHRFAAFAAAAYNPLSHIEKWTCKACKITGVKPLEVAVVDIKEEDGRFYVTHIDDDDGKHKLVVTFRGTITESTTNWVGALGRKGRP